jgi:hypothetical protein
MKFLYGDGVYTPVDMIVGVNCNTSAKVIIRCINQLKDSGGATSGLNHSQYEVSVPSGKEVEFGKRLVEEINFGKLDAIDLINTNKISSSVTFTETPT